MAGVIMTIMKLDLKGLLLYVLANPEYLTDSYYSDFGDAIRRRADELM